MREGCAQDKEHAKFTRLEALVASKKAEEFVCRTSEAEKRVELVCRDLQSSMKKVEEMLERLHGEVNRHKELLCEEQASNSQVLACLGSALSLAGVPFPSAVTSSECALKEIRDQSRITACRCRSFASPRSTANSPTTLPTAGTH